MGKPAPRGVPLVTTKARGIIFAAHSVRSILAGTKTMTRRIVRRLPHICDRCWNESVPHNANSLRGKDGTVTLAGAIFGADSYLRVPACSHGEVEWCGDRLRCRQGAVGDHLWVREVYAEGPIRAYRADYQDPDTLPFAHLYDEQTKWQTPIFMPRVASRLTLEITEVRVERLQQITKADANAEGCWDKHGGGHPERGCFVSRGPRDEFAQGWEDLNGARGYGWKTNPFVFVIAFRRIEVA
jgi:hypothetical protein